MLHSNLLKKTFILCVALFLALPVNAQYRVTVKRLSSNFYLILENKVLVKTAMCLNLALADKAILRQGSLYFVDDKDSCPVRAIYQEGDMQAGTYKVVVMQEADDFYRITADLYARTSGCIMLSMGDSGILTWNGSSGRISVGRDICSVTGIYNTLRLN